MHITRWKKPIQEVIILYDSKCMTFWKGKITETVKVSVVPREEGGGKDEQVEYRGILRQ